MISSLNLIHIYYYLLSSYIFMSITTINVHTSLASLAHLRYIRVNYVSHLPPIEDDKLDLMVLLINFFISVSRSISS